MRSQRSEGPGREPGEEGDDRSWMDLCADDEASGRGHHRGHGPKGWNPQDQHIYREVCERLLRDRLIDARGIEVLVDDGVVTLKGEARAAADPALAERLARDIPDVRGVVLDLKVHPQPRPAEPERDPHARTDRSPMGYPILPT